MSTFSRDDVKKLLQVAEEITELISQIPKEVEDHVNEVHKFNAPKLTSNVDSLDENLNGAFVNNLKQIRDVVTLSADGMNKILVAMGEV